MINITFTSALNLIAELIKAPMFAGIFSQNQTNKFFISFNNSTENTFEEAGNITKRSNDEEDDDNDADGDANGDNDDEDNNDKTCSSESKFHESVIPRRKKNYHFKRLERRSKSLKICGKKCCKTESCILSFMLENSCIGVLCSGDGNCHTRKDDLPQTSFELSITKRDGESHQCSVIYNEIRHKDSNKSMGVVSPYRNFLCRMIGFSRKLT